MLESGEGYRCTTCGQELFLDLNESVQLLPEIMYLIDLRLANGREEIGLAPNIISYAKTYSDLRGGTGITCLHLPYWHSLGVKFLPLQSLPLGKIFLTNAKIPHVKRDT